MPGSRPLFVLATGSAARGFDLMNAATALAHSAALHTRIGDDFTGLEDLVDVRALTDIL